MWTAPKDKLGGTPEQFNAHYLSDKPKGNHYHDIIQLTGVIGSKRVLDLGGGTLMVEIHEFSEGQYTLVDFSIEACSQAAELFRRHWKRRGFDTSLDYYCLDAIQWLKNNERRFDITLCFGLLEYLPATALADLCALCPSDVLCLGVSAAESYLQYPGRITIYSA